MGSFPRTLTINMTKCSERLEYFHYSAPAYNHIKSHIIAGFYRFLQLAILGGILYFVFLNGKKYQKEDVGLPGTTSKVKGVAYVDYPNPRIGNQLWDAEDIVIPSQEHDAFFVTTNVIVTNEQRQGECPETKNTTEALCKSNSDCLPILKPFLLGHGVSTGVCNTSTGTCMVKAWCPIEDKELVAKNVGVLNGTKDFTVFIKNHVIFPSFGVARSNIVESLDKKYLQGCTYDAKSDPLCPIFKLGYIVNEALKNYGTSTYDNLAAEGGVFSIKIKWNCDLDKNSSGCLPSYSFDWLESGRNDNLTGKGYNFRYTNKYFDANQNGARQLIKAYGFLFIITVDAKAGKFDFLSTLLAAGSSLMLFSIASFICEIWVYSITVEGHKYATEKVINIESLFRCIKRDKTTEEQNKPLVEPKDRTDETCIDRNEEINEA